MLTWKSISALAGTLVVVVPGTYEGAKWLDHHWAHREHLVQVELRLNQKVLSDRIYEDEHELRAIQKDFPNVEAGDAPVSVRERYWELTRDLEERRQERREIRQKRRDLELQEQGGKP